MKTINLLEFMLSALLIAAAMISFFGRPSISYAAGGTVTADKSLFLLEPTQRGTVTINWATTDGSEGQVYVSPNGAAEQLFVQGSRGSQSADWIVAPATFIFNLYAGTGHSVLLASTTVTAQYAYLCIKPANCLSGQLCLGSDYPMSARPLAIYAGIYTSPPLMSGYINKISHNFTGISGMLDGLQQSQVDELHAKGFKVMAHCDSLADCRQLAQEGADIIAFDEFKLRHGNGLTTENLTGALFNSEKAQYKAINPKVEVGIVEGFIPQYLSFYNEGADPDFVGLEQYYDPAGNLNSPCTVYSDFMNQVAAKFPRAKIHVWSDTVKAAELYKNRADVLIYFNIDNQVSLSAVETELEGLYGNPACVAKTCRDVGYVCGTAGDGCGDTLSCGVCALNQVCANNQCVANCVPKTCSTLGNYTCGSWSDGCATTINCGTCITGQTCSNGQCVVSGGGGSGGGGITTPPVTPPVAKIVKPVAPMTRVEILAKIAQIKILLIQLIQQLIVELQK